jgi:hypothetical protein
VLDVVRDIRHLWHQSVHHHPMLGGYLTRTPDRLETALKADPIAGPLKEWEEPAHQTPISAAAIDFPPDRPVVAGAGSTKFTVDLQGELNVTQPGPADFFLECNDSGQLYVDDHLVVDNRGRHPTREMRGVTTLTAGHHRILVRYQSLGGESSLRASWTPEGGERRLLGGSDVPAGFRGTANYHRREMLITREQGLSHLHALNVRYIVQAVGDSTYLIEGQLGLRPMYTGEGVRIYEVPAQ